MPQASYVLTLSCADRPGIVAAVSTYLFDQGCNILDAQQYNDVATGLFFMRVTFEAEAAAASLRGGFEPIAERVALTWIMLDMADRKRALILVSKFDHCLVDLLYRWRNGELPMDISAVVSNHPRETWDHIDLDDVPFHHLPVTRQTKMEQEAQLW